MKNKKHNCNNKKVANLSNHTLQEKLNQEVFYESSFSTRLNTPGTNNSS